MKKAFKITTVVFAVIVGLIIILTIAGLSYFFISTKDVKLDLDKLDGNYSNIQIYDNKNNQIMTSYDRDRLRGYQQSWFPLEIPGLAQ